MHLRLTFRAKLMTIVGATALAFLFLICAETYLTNKMDQQLSKIQKQYIPAMEFGPRLEKGFEHIRRGFQDSVAAQDREALAKMIIVKNNFLQDIQAAEAVIDSVHASALRESTEDYYAAAFDVSRRLISSDTGVALVNAMTVMQSKQAKVEALMTEALAFDRGSLAGTFSAIAQTQRTSGRTLVVASLASLFIIIILSLWLAQSVLHSLRWLSDGLKRFGRGDFSQPIQITSNDQLGEVANEANQMAGRIKSLLKELDSFSYSVAHDLRAPLRSIMGFSNIILEDFEQSLPQEAKVSMGKIVASSKKMGELIDGLLKLSRLARAEIKKNPVSLSTLAQDILTELQSNNSERKVITTIEKEIVVIGDPPLLQAVLTNLLGNAWKFTSKRTDARIEFGVSRQTGNAVYFVKDNGAGFDMKYVDKLFGTFQRLHSYDEFEGTGVGLATVQSIIRRHGGEIWAEAKVNQGAVFYFTIGRKVGVTDNKPVNQFSEQTKT